MVDPPEGLLDLNAAKADGRRRRLDDPVMKFDIVTIFPRMIEAGLVEGIVSRGIERGVLDIGVHDLRAFTTDRHRSVDDVPVRRRSGDGDEAGAARARRGAHSGRGARRAPWCC